MSTYVLVHMRTGAAVLVWTAEERLEFWQENNFEGRFRELGYRLCFISDEPRPAEHITQALANMEED